MNICNCDQVKELLEDAETCQIIQFLMGLNYSFNNIRGQILNMKPHPQLNDIYNMLDQDESQRLIRNNTKTISAPAAFQIEYVALENSQIMLAQGGFQKPKCSRCFGIGHTVDKCYKVHGYPPGHPQRGKNNKQTVSTNLATLGTQESHVKETENSMSKYQIQHMIAYLSSHLQGSSVVAPELNSVKLQTHCPTSENNFASTSTFVPSISQKTGTTITFKCSTNDMLISSTSKKAVCLLELE